MDGHFKSGYVAIAGMPNVGKSTLMNALLGQKISIVARKPQTTRQQVLGILTTEQVQIVFLDTPGLLTPQYLLQEKMALAARRALDDADVLLILIAPQETAELPDELKAVLSSLGTAKPKILCINKADLVQKESLLPLIEQLSRSGQFEEIVPLSALKEDNLDVLLKTLIQYLPEHPAFYPADLVSEHPERFFAAEMIREKIFEQFHEEIPYSTAVEIVDFKERKDGKVFISANIIVERDSQKGILIGKQGSALKRIGTTARRSIEQFIEAEVYLDLHVKVGEQWRKKEQWMRRLGYDVD